MPLYAAAAGYLEDSCGFSMVFVNTLILAGEDCQLACGFCSSSAYRHRMSYEDRLCTEVCAS